jgi:hypothetical protein
VKEGRMVLDDIRDYAFSIGAEKKEKKGIQEISLVIAERKAFLSKKRLTYGAKFRVDEGAQEIRFSEMLKETGSGISAGGGLDDGASAGFGFKKEVSRSGDEREGTIGEQSRLFGKDYSYQFDFQAVRKKIGELAQSSGYEFKYQIIPLGL